MSNEFILPPALERNDKVAIIGTSSGVQKFPKVLKIGVERLGKRFDLRPVVFETAEKDTKYLNSHPEKKAEEVMQAFENPEIKGVIALTGGTEQLRMLKYLDEDRLRENPTRFYGISDNTNLHIYLWNLGIQSFYGGQILDDLLAEGEIGDYTYNYLEKAFFDDKIGEIGAPEKYTDDFLDLFRDEVEDSRQEFDTPKREFWNFEDDIEGQVWGGCLSVVFRFMAVEGLMSETEKLEGKVLAIETSEEYPSIADVKKSLMVLGEREILQKFSAVIVGRPMREPLHGEEKTMEEKEKYRKSQIRTIKSELQRYAPDTPAVFNMNFGHTHPKVPIPIGGRISIKPEENSIVYY